MAYIATVKILVDDNNESVVYDGINEILRDAQMGGPNGECQDWVVDWKFDSVEPVGEELNDSIANETYEEGDAFADWVIFSASEARANDGAGFWSNEYGWTTIDLATKFDAIERERAHGGPRSAGMDAMWMLAPYGMEFYRLMLVEHPDDTTLDQTPIAFECFAENYDHAVEQAKNAYPGCKVLGTEGGGHE
jgi:hypothetical protein